MLGHIFTPTYALIFALLIMVLTGMFLLTRSSRQLTLTERNQLRAELDAKRPDRKRTDCNS